VDEAVPVVDVDDPTPVVVVPTVVVEAELPVGDITASLPDDVVAAPPTSPLGEPARSQAARSSQVRATPPRQMRLLMGVRKARVVPVGEISPIHDYRATMLRSGCANRAVEGESSEAVAEFPG